MKFCSHCGKEIMDEAVICPNCGCSTGNNVKNNYDAPSTGLAILGFFIPLVGLIIYLINKDDKPLKAKSAGKGALIGFITGIALSIISTILSFLLIGSVMDVFMMYL